MYVRLCLILIKISGMIWGKCPLSGLRFNRQNIAPIKIVRAAKCPWIDLSRICNMHGI